ncbi:TIGR02099 family protein [Pseudomonas pohangensis]|uniref:TIGR02099 family protein n=1 Tax=Pseudomonas pohangensis TaxID=364197 RepID=A0A1H2E5B2_9PSED|nr:YhdP family protein [Pseudomonas pohangensis]SDT90215.1 TIGR02099 family protein [Pseudomonas pohangensis]
MSWLSRLIMILIRGVLWSFTLSLVFAALYVSLGRQLMPLLGEYRAEVEQRAQSALGMPLKIGRLEGSWRDFSPLLVAHDVELGEGTTKIHLQTLRVKPDLLIGLLERRMEIQRLELDGLQLTIEQQSAEGAWAVAGLSPPREAAESDPQQAIKALLGISQLLLYNSQITLQPFAAKAIRFTQAEFELRNGRRQRIDGHLTFPSGLPLSFSLRGKLDPADWRGSPAELYLSLPQSSLAERIPSSLLGGWQIDSLKAGGELWAVVEAGQLQRVVTRLNATELQAAAADRQPVSVEDLALTAYLDRRTGGYDLLLDSLALSLDQQRFGPIRVGLQMRQATPESAPVWKAQADRLDLAPLTTLALSLAPAAPAVDEWLDGLQPHGQLSNIQVSLDSAKTTADRLQFAANLGNVGISAHADVPGLENVSGSISGDMGQGALRLNSENFVLDLAEVFPQPWQYFKAGALLSWKLDDQSFNLFSPYIKLEGDEGRIAGELKIAIPFADDQFAYMDLLVGLQDGNAAFTSKYLPTPGADFTAELADWLKTAIVGGAIDEGIFQYQGTLSTQAPANSSTLSLYFKLHDLELAYQPGWPALQEAAGEVFVGDSGVQVNVSSGKVLDSQVSNVTASVPPAGNGQVARLQLTADLQSNVKDGLDILQKAPLGTESVFAGWQGTGALDGKLSLDIPLGGTAAPLVVVDFAAKDAQLSIPEPVLELSGITAAFRYNSASGLSTPALRARAFNQPVSGKIVAEGARGRTRTRIEATSKIALADLTKWLDVAEVKLPVSGTLPYKLNVILDENNSQLQVDSSLRGLAVDLPAPFGKRADEVRNSSFSMPLTARVPTYRANYAGMASLALAMPDGKADSLRAELVLGGETANLPDSQGFWLRGRVAELDAEAWKALAEQYSGTAPSSSQDMLRSVHLQVGQFHGFGMEASDLGLSLERAGSAWQIGLNSAMVEGEVTVPDQDGQPIVLNLQRLSLPEPPTTDAEAMAKPDALADIEPASLPPLDVKIAKVMLGSEALGASSFKLRPVPGGVQFNELNMDFKGLQVTGTAGWDGHKGATSSWYKGRLQGTDLGKVLQAWNYAPSVESERFRVDGDIRWPGSPAWLDLARMSGTLDGSIRNGRFTEVQGGGSSALRVFGLLNFSAIGRRLRLDFSDLFGKGLAFDRVKVLLAGDNGVFVTRKPLEVNGPSVQLQLDGTLNMVQQSIDAKLYVTLPVSNTVALGALLVGAPAVAGAIFVADKVADKLFGFGTSNLTKVQYQVKGPLEDPKITFFKP